MPTIPLPVPVVLPPELFNVNVHAPFAVIVPLTEVLVLLQIEAAPLVIAATGRAFTVTTADPERSAEIEVQLASTKEAIE